MSFMNISHLTSDTLRQLLPLTDKRDELLKHLRALENEIAGALTGAGSAIVEAITPAKTKDKVKAAKVTAQTRSGRGQLKEQILALLGAAGDAGLGVQEIADRLGVKAGNIYVWFSSTGKSLTSKISPGRYVAHKTSAPVSAKNAKPAKAISPSVSAAKPAKIKRGPSLEARAKMAAAAKARWARRAVPAAAKPVKAGKKSGLTPEGRAKLAANMKARWAARRAAKSASKPLAPVKKAVKAGKQAAKPVKKGFKLPRPE